MFEEIIKCACAGEEMEQGSTAGGRWVHEVMAGGQWAARGARKGEKAGVRTHLV